MYEKWDDDNNIEEKDENRNKYKKTINDLININIDLSGVTFYYLLSDLGILRFGEENKSIHFFISGIDWNGIYTNSNNILEILSRWRTIIIRLFHHQTIINCLLYSLLIFNMI